MKELEELTREIREKLTRLKELSKGCIIESSEKVFEIDDLMYAVCDNDQIFDRFTDSWIFSDEYQIIGKEPMLNDVMEYLSIKAVEFAFTQNGFYAYDNYIERWGDFIPVNLQSPYLKDQSPELIKFLHSLIKTKQ